MHKVKKIMKLLLVALIAFTALFNFGNDSAILANELSDNETITESDIVEKDEKEVVETNEAEITTTVEDGIITVEDDSVDLSSNDSEEVNESEDSARETRAGPTTRAGTVVASRGSTGYSHSGTASGNGHTAWFTDQEILMLTGDGTLGWCVEPWEVVSNPAGTSGYTPNASKMDAIDSYILHGYYLRGKSTYNYAVVQLMIWELGYGYVPSSHTVPNYQTEKASILASIAQNNTKLSFTGQTIKVRVGTPVTITDTNGVLNSYSITVNNTGVNIVKSGNTLTLTATADDVDGTVRFARYMNTGMPDNSILWTNPTEQDVYSGGSQDPVFSTLNIEVEKFGSLEIAKKDNLGNYISGAKFDVFYNSGDDAGTKIGSYTTGADGKVKIDDILPEEVKIVETYVPSPLVLESTPAYATIIPNETVTYTKTNQRVTGTAKLYKVDKDTGLKIPLGEADLDDAVYGLYAGENIKDGVTGAPKYSTDQLVKSEVIGSDLEIVISGLEPGIYYFKEISASNGYNIDPNKYTLDLRYVNSATAVVTKQATSKQEVKRGNIKVQKFINTEGSGIKLPEFGAVFKVQIEDEVQLLGEANAPVYATITTDIQGMGEANNLPWAGKSGYRVTQTKAANENLGLAPAWNSKIVNHGETLYYIVGNELHTSYLQVYKYDEDLGENIIFPATFKIWDVDNNEWYSEVVGNKQISEWATDENGMLITNKVLPAGKYELVETGTPSNYLDPEERVPFEIKASNVHEVNIDGKPILVIRVSNQAPKGKLVLNKLFERVEGLHDDETLVSGWKVTYVDHDVLANYDNETVVHYEGEQLVNAQSADGLFYATEDEVLEMLDIYIGSGEGTTLKFEEVVVPEGYVKADDFTVNFKKDKDDNQTKIIEIDREIENKVIRTDLEVVKKNKYSEEIVKDIEGFEFTLYADEELTQEIETVSVDPTTGSAVFKNLPYSFNGYLVETAVPEGWILSDEVVNVIINGETEGLGNTYSIEYYNKPEPTLGTKATHINGSKVINPDIDNILIDDCDYTGVDTSLVYDKIWELRKSSTGEIILTETESEVTFPTYDGTYRINVFVPAGTLEAGEDYYFAEYIKVHGEDIPYVEHNDPEDEGQTVRTEEPTLGTLATGLNNEKVFDPTIDNIMIDVASYTGIDPNFVYDRVWEIRDSETQELVLSDVEKDTRFDTPEGKYTVTVNVPAYTLENGKSYYFVEKLVVKTVDEEGNEKEEIFVEHNDPKDEGQAVRMEETEFKVYINKVDSISLENIKKDFEFTADVFDQDGKLLESIVVKGDAETGIATFTFTGAGTYGHIEFRESDAPLGYALSDEVVKVTMDDFNDENTYSFKYVNTMMPAAAVVAGDVTNTNMLVLMSLISLGLVVVIASKKRKGRVNE
ncbi:SpaA isopeptide-forming pilin-related protein [Breznakia pachnodae]|uniref:Uncharacterized protein n=1 Tax=Breznakia pachnodae TaxID=265178 RepID=A0ABU0E3V7_9FIRM|nr:SpaA isopeptide-forming pilin-related protein [Breznakia pachnodae]MDQ0361570.1 hypothetical protein [Breznakia pachnodae]